MIGKVVNTLREGKRRYPQFADVFDHAAVLAKEADYRASYTSDLAMTAIEPTYEPLVLLLAEAIEQETRNA